MQINNINFKKIKYFFNLSIFTFSQYYFPNKKVFIYQIVDKKGVNQREFTISGFETLNIDNNEVDTIRIICSELRLIFNVSKDHNFMPVYINKTNGKTNYEFTLTDYNQ